jgi:hypothetical protein
MRRTLAGGSPECEIKHTFSTDWKLPYREFSFYIKSKKAKKELS